MVYSHDGIITDILPILVDVEPVLEESVQPGTQVTR